MPIRQYFKKITKSASAMQDWTTKQAALNFGWVSPVFVHLRVENLLFWVLEGYCTDVGISSITCSLNLVCIRKSVHYSAH